MAIKITGAQLVAAFRQYIAEGWGYVYGANGELYTEKLAKTWHEDAKDDDRDVPDGRDPDSYFIGDCSKWIGRNVADCSGGIVHAIRQFDPTFKDRTANTFKSQFSESGPIKTIPEIPGLAVWRSGHIGIYAGNGKVLEFRGTDYGCVETNLSERNFTRWGKIKVVDYTTTTTTATPSTTTTATGKAYHAKCSGGSVYVRSGPGTTNKAVGVARKDDVLLALPAKNGWCEVAAFIGGKLVLGYMSASYVKKL